VAAQLAASQEGPSSMSECVSECVARMAQCDDTQSPQLTVYDIGYQDYGLHACNAM
jgi:hypothetical protein